MQISEEIKSAEARIRKHVRLTPVEDAYALSADTDCNVILKLENFQKTGSFKLRGAFNKMLLLDEDIRSRGVVAASTGNHGAAVACAAAALDIPATVYVPTHADETKLKTIRAYGADIQAYGTDCVDAERQARAFSDDQNIAYVSPYNDVAVVAGQGSLGVELSNQIETIDAVFVSMGGGGLISGVGSYLKTINTKTEVVACSPANSCVMHQSLEAGELLDLPSEPTLSDGTAGGVEAGSITFGLCQSVVDHSVLVSEDEIAHAMRHVVSNHHVLIEGAAGAAVAGFLKERHRYVGKTVVILLCGANISMEVMKRVLG